MNFDRLEYDDNRITANGDWDEFQWGSLANSSEFTEFWNSLSDDKLPEDDVEEDEAAIIDNLNLDPEL